MSVLLTAATLPLTSAPKTVTAMYSRISSALLLQQLMLQALLLSSAMQNKKSTARL